MSRVRAVHTGPATLQLAPVEAVGGARIYCMHWTGSPEAPGVVDMGDGIEIPTGTIPVTASVRTTAFLTAQPTSAGSGFSVKHGALDEGVTFSTNLTAYFARTLVAEFVGRAGGKGPYDPFFVPSPNGFIVPRPIVETWGATYGSWLVVNTAIVVTASMGSNAEPVPGDGPIVPGVP